MTYHCDLGTGQLLTIHQQGGKTTISITSQSLRQQQSQQSTFTTGEWVVPPTLFRTAAGLILRIEADQGQQFMLIQASGITGLRAMPPLAGADVLPLRQGVDPVAMPPIEPLSPLPPMPPMQMGDMVMQMQPMAMRMGNLHMQMDTSPAASPPVKRFCSQCGQGVEVGDRFCAHCGHQL
jgi:zinc-ribbon domain